MSYSKVNIPYLIYCAPGTGGLFLTSVISQLIGLKTKATFSNTGHAHNMGKGNWQGSDDVCFIGCHWELNYKPDYLLYYTHVIPEGFLETTPNIKTLIITADECDYRKITELMVKKAWPDIWSEDEYKKWATPNYPPYDPNNITTSEIVSNDIINDLVTTNITPWFEKNKKFMADYIVDFRTVMGLGELNLLSYLTSVFDICPTEELKTYVEEYQQLNKKMYFKNYV